LAQRSSRRVDHGIAIIGTIEQFDGLPQRRQNGLTCGCHDLTASSSNKAAKIAALVQLRRQPCAGTRQDG
jgi:hypothetical protein